jgi:hypothetical protein
MKDVMGMQTTQNIEREIVFQEIERHIISLMNNSEYTPINGVFDSKEIHYAGGAIIKRMVSILSDKFSTNKFAFYSCEKYYREHSKNNIIKWFPDVFNIIQFHDDKEQMTLSMDFFQKLYNFYEKDIIIVLSKIAQLKIELQSKSIKHKIKLSEILLNL